METGNIAKVIRDGKVAVLVSSGYGAGWSTWNGDSASLIFDPELVYAVESGNEQAILDRAAILEPDGYFGGIGGLRVHWLDAGTKFRIDEYDGAEGVEVLREDMWMTA